jgi:hypothetical protein
VDFACFFAVVRVGFACRGKSLPSDLRDFFFLLGKGSPGLFLAGFGRCTNRKRQDKR